MKLFSLFYFILFFAISLQSQTHISRQWDVQSGNPVLLQWSNSVATANSNLVTIGNNSVQGEGTRMMVTRFDKYGNILWQNDYSTSPYANDYGAAVTEDVNGNIYAIGTTDNNSTDNHDAIILKYDDSGSLIWSKVWDSGYNLNDIATGVVTDNQGDVFISIASDSPTNLTDFVTIRLDSNGNILWENRYDNAGLIDAPIGIELLQNGNVLITGGSASSYISWDYTVVLLSSSGDYLQEKRVNISNSGFDQPLAYAKDASENIYITGKTSNDGINYDLTTVKITSNYTIEWIKTVDYAGKVDVGNSVKVDNNGDIYVGGYVTKPDDTKSMILIKYDTNGQEIWKRIENSRSLLKDLELKTIEIDGNNNIYIASQEEKENNQQVGLLTKVKQDGNYEWRREVNDANENNITSIRSADDGTLYVTAIKNDAVSTYHTMRYDRYEQDTTMIYTDNGVPSYKDHELIVRFKASAIDTSTINNTRIEFGDLNQFLTPQAYSQFINQLNDYCFRCDIEIKVVKVFKQLTTANQSTISRLGTEVKILDLWTALLLDIESNDMDMYNFYEFLTTMPELIAYAEPNYIGIGAAVDDPLYDVQASLHSTSSFPNAHINIEEAWYIFPDAGYPFVKVGVVDNGIQYAHEDFGYDGVNVSSSKIKGWDFGTNATLTSLSPDSTHFYNHGTHCAGIIGALRNNETGIAGIAGGNGLSNMGASIYGLRILNQEGSHAVPFLDVYSPAQYIYDALVMSAIDSTADYTYGLHISSNSWRFDDSLKIGHPNNPFYTDTNLVLMKEAVHFNNRMQVSFVACRGNEGYNSNTYPATIDDDWVLSVGGSGVDGKYKDTISQGNDGSWAPSYGQGMDIIAPSTSNIIWTTNQHPNGYSNFNGTSAATSHVSGTVALLMSYLNDPFPSYNNLAPEDCERIIELSATDVGPVDYDSLNGWGRLNAGQALRLVEKPFRKVQHYGTTSAPFNKNIEAIENQLTIHLKEPVQNEVGTWFPKGDYTVNAYKIKATVNHNLPPTDSIMYFWARPSMSTVFGPIKNDTLLPRERIAIDSSSFTSNSCSMTGYVYELFDTNGQPVGWLPFDTTLTKAHFEYTILTHAVETNSINEEDIANNIKLYPNPSNSKQNLVISLHSASNLKIDLYDLQGRLIKPIFKGKQNTSEKVIEIDIEFLSSEMYLYRIETDDKVQSIQFIKQ